MRLIFAFGARCGHSNRMCIIFFFPFWCVHNLNCVHKMNRTSFATVFLKQILIILHIEQYCRIILCNWYCEHWFFFFYFFINGVLLHCNWCCWIIVVICFVDYCVASIKISHLIMFNYTSGWSYAKQNKKTWTVFGCFTENKQLLRLWLDAESVRVNSLKKKQKLWENHYVCTTLIQFYWILFQIHIAPSFFYANKTNLI